MGQFPYVCARCGGGYERCALRDTNGQEAHEDCDGGQFCWEDEVMCETIRVVIGDGSSEDKPRDERYCDFVATFDRGMMFEARYMGYGNFEADALPDYVIYGEHEVDSATEANYIVVRVWCRSCYMGGGY